jgi:dinuclear metal center YbgI/SA1388 family protein
MSTTVGHLLPFLDNLAPRRLAEAWDNVGLQIGSRSWPVRSIWTALDPSPEVVARACDNDVDLLVTHHPLFFKPIKQIDAGSPTGTIIDLALSHRLAIYSAHTNLDSVHGGVNDELARRLGLTRVQALSGGMPVEMAKLVVFVPKPNVHDILDTLFAMDAGRIGRYAHCTFRCEGIGTFTPDTDAEPASGTPGTLNEAGEARIEVRLPVDAVDRVVSALKTVHPYETMAYDTYPITVRDPAIGLGRIGVLPEALSLDELARRVKTQLGLGTVKVVGERDMTVRQVAVCSGSGGSLLHAAVTAGAQVFVSGDLGYHTARDAQQAGVGLIDAGHFGTEQLIVPVLADAIADTLGQAGIDVVVAPAEMERDPFDYL